MCGRSSNCMPCNAIHKQLTSIRVKFPWNCVNSIRNGRAMKHSYLLSLSHSLSPSLGLSLSHSHALSRSSKFCIVINDEPEWCTAVQLKYFNSKNIKVITLLAAHIGRKLRNKFEFYWILFCADLRRKKTRNIFGMKSRKSKCVNRFDDESKTFHEIFAAAFEHCRNMMNCSGWSDANAHKLDSGFQMLNVVVISMSHVHETAQHNVQYAAYTLHS